MYNVSSFKWRPFIVVIKTHTKNWFFEWTNDMTCCTHIFDQNLHDIVHQAEKTYFQSRYVKKHTGEFRERDSTYLFVMKDQWIFVPGLVYHLMIVRCQNICAKVMFIPFLSSTNKIFISKMIKNTKRGNVLYSNRSSESVKSWVYVLKKVY
jgi:hypothetical protein